MITDIHQQQQMLQGNSAMPMNEGDKSVEGNSKNMPFNPNTFPNSENVRPPQKKEALRVVEPSTRTSVALNINEKYQRVIDAYQKLDRRTGHYVDFVVS